MVLGGTVSIAAALEGTSAVAQNISVSPSSTEVKVPPGGTVSNSFDAINEGGTPYTAAFSASPYHIEGTNYDPQFTPLPGMTDASKWVHLIGSTTQTLTAYKLVSIDYTVSVPQNTAPGGYYAVLFTETTPISASNGVVSHNRVGDILYITVEGAVKTGGSVQPISIPYVATTGSLGLGMLVSNTGGVHFLTTADTTVKSIFGQTVFHASLQRYVLPQTVRSISASWNNLPPIGLYSVERSATIAGAFQQLPVQWVLVVQPWVMILLIIAVLFTVAMLVSQQQARKRRQ